MRNYEESLYRPYHKSRLVEYMKFRFAMLHTQLLKNADVVLILHDKMRSAIVEISAKYFVNN